jgi:hypothetical protein
LNALITLPAHQDFNKPGQVAERLARSDAVARLIAMQLASFPYGKSDYRRRVEILPTG